MRRARSGSGGGRSGTRSSHGLRGDQCRGLGQQQEGLALGGEEGAKVAQNVVAGVAGLFIWPLWFAMDFQGAAPKAIAALQARQQYLATLAEQRCGAVPPLPIQTIPGATTGGPSVVPVTPAPASPAPSPVPASAASSSFDGPWLIDMKFHTGNTPISRCPETSSLSVTFANRSAGGAWGRLRMTIDRDVSDSMLISNTSGATINQPISLMGRAEGMIISGTSTGSCAGSFTMSRPTPAPGGPAYSPVPTPTNDGTATPQVRELSCINPDGSFLRTTAANCPPPSQPLKL